ncbi:hypothetical protein BDR04DRAFT_959251, partial [Suillus decipiens]
RSMSLIFDDFQLESFQVKGGINQGCPLSPLAFIFYNTDLLRVTDPRPCKEELSLEFIDNIALIAKGESY